MIGDHPLFGLGINTFSQYYEFVTGMTNWGPHSYYVAMLTETGIVGTVAVPRLPRLPASGVSARCDGSAGGSPPPAMRPLRVSARWAGA